MLLKKRGEIYKTLQQINTGIIKDIKQTNGNQTYQSTMIPYRDDEHFYMILVMVVRVVGV